MKNESLTQMRLEKQKNEFRELKRQNRLERRALKLQLEIGERDIDRHFHKYYTFLASYVSIGIPIVIIFDNLYIRIATLAIMFLLIWFTEYLLTKTFREWIDQEQKIIRLIYGLPEKKEEKEEPK